MTVIDQVVVGGATPTFVTSGFTASVPGAGQTYTVDDDTGYPITGKFVVVLDRGTPDEEKILVNSRSGATFTIGARGYDGTTATSHTTGQATHEHALSAVAIQLVFDHINGVEVNPHAGVLLNNAAHDIEARHQFGAAYGTPVTPTALTPDIAGAAGVGNNPAREDHAHNVPAATATSITGVNAEGNSSSFARANHDHAYAALSIATGALQDDAVTAAKAADGIIDAVGKFASGMSAVFNGTTDFGGLAGAHNIWVDTNTNPPIIKIRNAANSAWITLVDVTGWTSYAPTLMNTSIGTGTVWGRYKRIGKTIVVEAGFQYGSTSVLTGEIGFSLPSTATFTPATLEYMVGGRAYDRSANQVWASVGTIVATDPTNARGFATAGNVAWQGGGAPVPFPWSSGSPGDNMSMFCVYEET